MPNKPRNLSWDDLPQTERDLYLKLLWADDHTEQAIADFLLTTKGTIVGRRRRLGVGNKGRGTVKKVVDPERFRDLLDLHRMEQLEEQNGGAVVCIAPVESPEPVAAPEEILPEVEVVEHVQESEMPTKPKKRTDESLPPKQATHQKEPEQVATCQWPLLSGGTLKEPKLCGEPVEPGERLCARHRAMLRKRQT